MRKIPGVGQRLVRLDGEDLAVQHAAPVSAKIETVTHDRLEVVLHQPLLDQVRLRERAPELFRRIRDLPFDNDGARFGRGIAHWSILLSRSSRWSNRLCQKPAIWLVQSISGAKRAELRAIVRLAAFVAVAHQPGLLQDPEML